MLVERNPLFERIETAKRGGRGHAKPAGIADQFRQRSRQSRQCAHARIDKQLRLQGRSQARIVVEEPEHVLERRITDVTKRQSRQASKTTLLEIVRQARGNIGHELGRGREVIANGAYAQIRSQPRADGGFNLTQRGRLTCTLAGQPSHLSSRGIALIRELNEPGIKSSEPNELRRLRNAGEKRLRAAHCRH